MYKPLSTHAHQNMQQPTAVSAATSAATNKNYAILLQLHIIQGRSMLWPSLMAIVYVGT